MEARFPMALARTCPTSVVESVTTFFSKRLARMFRIASSRFALGIAATLSLCSLALHGLEISGAENSASLIEVA